VHDGKKWHRIFAIKNKTPPSVPAGSAVWVGCECDERELSVCLSVQIFSKMKNHSKFDIFS
jgi:hypothetical protein